MAVHEFCRLHMSSDRFVVEPIELTTSESKGEALVIDRVTHELSIQSNPSIAPDAYTRNIYGIVGIIRLIAGPYLVVITKKSKVGEINGQTIWKVEGTDVLSYQRTVLHLNEAQIQDNKQYVSMIESVMKTDGFYFSTTYDLTHTLQRLNNTSPEFLQIPLHERADQRFVYNHHLLRELAQQSELAQYCLPLLHGFVAIKSCAMKGCLFNYALISRRSCFRSGTRYYIRGLDSEGHAANFVESEQILEYEGHRCSFVQTRGSIPLYWSQKPNLKYKPVPRIHDNKHLEGFSSHFTNQIYNYGKQVLVNLIDQKGVEDRLEKAFSAIVNESHNDSIRYIAFDFHKECSKMRWHRLSLLMDNMAEDQKRFGYFMIMRDKSVPCQQEGVFRTNCMDCLDRTNVVQSLLARRSLQSQLERLNVLQAGEIVEDQTDFEYIFKNVWADNANAVSVQYAGTGALKTDFTRTGQRTKYGLLMDGYNSCVRYYKNNFSDGFRQDSIDLFLGNYMVDENEGSSLTCPLRIDRDWKFYAMPAILLVAFSMFMVCLLMPDENFGEQLMYLLFWGGATFGTLALMIVFGIEFVDRPKLTQARAKID